MATAQEMQVVLTLASSNWAADEAYWLFGKHAVEKKPVWSRMLPLHVARTNAEQRHLAFNGFAVPIKALVGNAENGGLILGLQDSAHLFQQVRKAEILLDSSAFKPENLLTPQRYKQPQARRKVHGQRFYRFSQPLFSPDSSFAYIQLDAAGSRVSYSLSKKDGRWGIIRSAVLWVE